MRRATVTTAVLALALAGCKKPAPEARESDVSNALTEVPAEVDAPVPSAESAAPTPPPVATVAPAARPPAPAERTVREEQQISEDADASGMTARLPADGDTQPADQQAEEAQDKR